MTAKKEKKSSKKGSQKSFATKRTVNPPRAGQDKKVHHGDSTVFQEHDTANRLGSYEERGNHARTGNRGHQ